MPTSLELPVVVKSLSSNLIAMVNSARTYGLENEFLAAAVHNVTAGSVTQLPLATSMATGFQIWP